VDRETLEYWGGSNIRNSFCFRDPVYVVFDFQDALVEQEVCSELLFI
jgi:hypothetical protein